MPNIKGCSVAGDISAGAICAESLTQKTSDMTAEEYAEFLLPNEERGGAIAFSTEDIRRLFTAAIQLCRKAGPFCSYEARSVINEVQKKVTNLETKTKGKKNGKN